ncbi:MAG: RNA methyltransferase [Candidatus Izemoplasmatales bacterium]
MTIASLQNERIAELLRLDRRRHRDETGRFVVEGPHLVAEAVAAGLCETVFAVADPGFTGIETFLVTEPVMAKIAATYAPQGVLAIVRRPAPRALGDRVLLLDGIQDPGNMGTLLRTALAFGFATVVADGCVDWYNQKVLRATQGAVFRLNLLEADLTEFSDAHPGWAVYGTDPHGGIPLDRFVPPAGPFALLLGNEGAGVRPALLAAAAKTVRIETTDVESLNVAVAGAIAMYRMRAR